MSAAPPAGDMASASCLATPPRPSRRTPREPRRSSWSAVRLGIICMILIAAFRRVNPVAFGNALRIASPGLIAVAVFAFMMSSTIGGIAVVVSVTCDAVCSEASVRHRGILDRRCLQPGHARGDKRQRARLEIDTPGYRIEQRSAQRDHWACCHAWHAAFVRDCIQVPARPSARRSRTNLGMAVHDSRRISPLARGFVRQLHRDVGGQVAIDRNDSLDRRS